MPGLDVLGVVELQPPYTSYKWASSLFEGPSRGVELLSTMSQGEGGSSDTERRASGVDTPGVEKGEGDNRLTSQISRINPDRCRRRSPSHPKADLHPPGICASVFSYLITHGFIVNYIYIITFQNINRTNQ